MPTIAADSVFCTSTGGCNLLVGRRISGLPRVLESSEGPGFGLDTIDLQTGWIFDSPGGTVDAPGGDSPYTGFCAGGSIQEPPYPPWWRSYSHPLLPITYISLPCNAGWWRFVCHSEVRNLMKLWSTWKWLL